MAINSDTNRVKLSVTEEAQAGSIPLLNTYEVLRNSSQSDLNYNINTEPSKEILADRQIKDTYVLSADTSGSIDFEFSLDSHDTLLEGAMFSRWQTNKISNFEDEQAVLNLYINRIDRVDDSNGSLYFLNSPPFIVNSILLINGFDSDFDGALVQVTAVFTSYVDFTVLNGKIVNDYQGKLESIVIQCGFAVQGDLKATADNKLTTTTTDLTTLNLNPRQWIKIGSNSNSANDGFDAVANNKLVKIESISANEIILDSVPDGWVEDLNATNKNIALFYDSFIKNGVEEISYTLEREFTDHSPIDYEYFTGMRVNTFEFNSEQNSIISGKFSFMGQDVIDTQTQYSNYGYISYNTTPLNSSNNVLSSILDGEDLSAGGNAANNNLLQKLSFTINNNLRGQYAQGSLFYADIGTGSFDVTGSATSYFNNFSIRDKLKQNVEMSFYLTYFDNSQNRLIIFDLPRIKLTKVSPSVSGKDEDVTVDFDFQALKSLDDSGYTLSISKITTY